MNSDLAGKILKRDKRSIARGITIIENSNTDSAELLKKIYSNIVFASSSFHRPNHPDGYHPR